MAHSDYSDKHRVFLQFVLEKRMLSERDTLDEYSRLFGNSNGVNITNTILVINNKLKDIGLEIVKSTCEVSKKYFYILTPVIKRSFSLKTSHYSQEEIILYQDIAIKILNSENGFVDEIYALNVSAKRFKSKFQSVINKFVRDNWLVNVDGYLYLTPLSIAELETEFNENNAVCLNYCSLCNRVVVHGRICPACKTVFHHHCVNKYELNIKVKKCPKCSKDWPSTSISDAVNYSSDEDDDY